ncbi:MAG: LamG-like jellyroll fold domain-containing protein [Gracilimonas sp.]
MIREKNNGKIKGTKFILTIQCLILITLSTGKISAQQIDINRINQMPDFPSPYLMRDWEEVTKEYDSFVFDVDATGQYLPVLFFRNNTVNYPDDISFGLHTVVGTTSPTSGEAINVIPALVGATLVGIDKSDQDGYNWVRMSREFFNKRPEENVYLNHPSTESGDDWWYATMPSVFFYQLYDLYPEIEEFDYQLRSVADQWLTAIETMGGSATPWNVPYMDYRGWYLSTMTPYTGGVKEPEAAGALAWMLYHAYKETGEAKYRMGAEWAMEFLNDYPSNPSYELQLLYGTYIAAKMNAELGTEYDIEKMMNWNFDVGPLRQWGSIVGNWGGYDVSGLIGEVNGTNDYDYAFSMNTFQLAGALLPSLRYDDRFANALGKWMLNASNASRLFYTEYLPTNKQDSDEWASEYDTNSVLGHEAMRESKFGISPYATGDAIDGGWGSTNLTLYSSSHVGIFGSIIDTTDVEGILKLDLLKTDFFRDEAYPTYLIYNPYESSQTITIHAGDNSRDIYETTTNTFLASGVSGDTGITIPALSSYIIVLTPSGGSVSYELDKMLVDNVIVDYMSGQTVSNYPPRIKSLASASTQLLKSDSTLVYASVVDNDKDELEYTWSTEVGYFLGDGPTVTWVAPVDTGHYSIQVQVSDGNAEPLIEQIQIEVVEKFNTAPKIIGLNAEPRKIDLGDTSEIECLANDEDGDEITISWTSTDGNIEGTNGKIQWTAPEEEGNYYIKCSASDPDGASAVDSIAVSVRDLSVTASGNLVLFLPFNGDAVDESGNDNAVTVSGAALTTDRFNAAQNAYKFDGVNDYMRVTNDETLNISNAISLNFWMNVSTFYEREQYPISHGNWENRWKISISDNKIRWTINTSEGITDLDSETNIKANQWYNITAYYSGADLELYINGKLDAFKYWGGSINASPVDLTIGQVLPGNNEYNFNGKIDEIRLYDYPLSLQEISDFYELGTDIEKDSKGELPNNSVLYQNYPNPFNPSTNITFTLRESGLVSLKVYNMLGQEVDNIIQQKMNTGVYTIRYDASSLSSGMYVYRLKTANVIQTQKMILIK